MVGNISWFETFFYKLIQQSINICPQFLDCGWVRMAIIGIKKVWKTVESQGKISEKSVNFEMESEWQPCLIEARGEDGKPIDRIMGVGEEEAGLQATFNPPPAPTPVYMEINCPWSVIFSPTTVIMDAKCVRHIRIRLFFLRSHAKVIKFQASENYQTPARLSLCNRKIMTTSV